MSANEYQVGGDHYAAKEGYQHWDWVIDVGLGYFEGQATKYVTRWRKKHGVEDLKKAKHYVEKLWENRYHVRKVNRDDLDLATIYKKTDRFGELNKLTPVEVSICRGLADWYFDADLEKVLKSIAVLMEEANEPRPVPVEDSNKYAERA